MIKKQIFLAIILHFTAISLFSQKHIGAYLVENQVIRINALPPGINIEQRIAKRSTLLFEMGLGFSYQYSNYYGSDLRLFPYLAIEPRVYFNLERRKEKGKRTEYNSGFFYGAKIQGGTEVNSEYKYFEVAPMIGFQKVLGRRWYWCGGFGYGPTFNSGNIVLHTQGLLKLGFILY